MAVDPVTLSVMYFAILLGFGILIANVMKRLNVPDALFLLLAGMLFGPTVLANPIVTQHFTFSYIDVAEMGIVPDFFRELALIMVIFVGTFNINFRVFKKYSNLTIKLAFLGVVFNTVVLGLSAHFLFGIDLGLAFLLGAVIGGTETTVICTLEKSLSKSKDALSIIKVESIFNSPFSVLIPLMVLDLIMITPGAMIEPMKYLSQFWLMITAGVGTGIIVGLAVSKIAKGIVKEYTPLILLAIALISYALATGVGGSGMLAVAICGLIAGNFSIRKREEKEELIHFQDQFSELLRIAVFTLLGAQVALFMTIPEFAVVIVFFLIAVVTRPLMLLVLMGDLKKKFSKKDIMIMGLIAPRGLSAAALTPILVGAVITAGRPELGGMMVNIVFLFIILSVLFGTIVAKIAAVEKFPSLREMFSRKKKEEKPKEGKSLVEQAFGENDPVASMLEVEGKEAKSAKGAKKKKGGR